MSVSGLPPAVQANVPYTFTMHIDLLPTPGDWEGLLVFGPAYAPEAIEVPVYVSQAKSAKFHLPFVRKKYP